MNWLLEFGRDWREGLRIIIAVGVLGGLILMAGGLVGGLALLVFVELPAELLFKSKVPESYWLPAVLFGCATFGVAGLGKVKESLIGAMRDKTIA